MKEVLGRELDLSNQFPDTVEDWNDILKDLFKDRSSPYETDVSELES